MTRQERGKRDTEDGENSAPAKRRRAPLCPPAPPAPSCRPLPSPPHIDNGGPSSSRRDASYRPGSIKRIELCNFITFDHVQIEPGPGLNLVLGANGTGKSSLVCALCLGLAGSPAVLGRGALLEEFVKNGKRKGWTEITLSDCEDIRIRRTLFKEAVSRGEPVWCVNGARSSEKHVKEVVASFQIQLENLTQFLPQDKVGSFARLGPVERLRETQRAIGHGLLNQHEALISLHTKESTTREELQRHVVDLERLRKQNEAIERDVQRMKERDTYLDKIKQLRLKRPWLLVDRALALVREAEESIASIKADKTEHEKHFAPCRKTLRIMEEKRALMTEAMEEVQSRMKQEEDRLRGLYLDLEKTADAIAVLEDEITQAIRRASEKQMKIDRMKKEVAAIEEEVAELPSEADIHDAIEKLNQQKSDIRHNFHQLQQKQRSIQERKMDITREINSFQRRLHALTDEEEQRRRLLETFDGSALKAFDFVRNNARLFRKRVYGPVLVEVSVADPDCASYLEFHINKDIKKTVVCEAQEDREMLYHKFREHNIFCTVVRVDSCEFAPRHTFHPNEAKKMGILGYLDEFVEAPHIVKTWLCRQYHIDEAIVCKEEARDQDVLRHPAFQKVMRARIYKPGWTQDLLRSKYTGEVTCRGSGVRSAQFINKKVDNSAERAQIQEELERLGRTLSTIEGDLRPLAEEEARHHGKAEKIVNEMMRWNKMRTSHRQLRQRIATKQDTLRNEEKTRVDPAALQARNEERILEMIRGWAEKVEGLSALLLKCVDLSMKQDGIHLELTKARNACGIIKEKLHTGDETYRVICQKLKTTEETLRTRKRDARERTKEAENHAPRTPENEEIFCQLPDGLEELDDMVDQLQLQADLVVQDQDLIQRYEMRRQEIAKLGADVENETREAQRVHEEVEALKTQWLPSLQCHISRIHNAFSAFFEDFGAVGCVKLDGVETDDYEKFGVKLMVKFRDEEELSDLSSHRHSGGERAVTTMLFLMSLQEVTPVPFRVVDEINQGMDVENERRVMSYVMQSASRPGTPQYFLFSPKLVANLDYTPEMSVFFIYNGPWSVGQGECSTP